MRRSPNPHHHEWTYDHHHHPAGPVLNANRRHHCYYFAGVRPQRAVELAHAADAAVCCQNVDYYSVHYDGHAAYDDPPVLIADHQARPAVTICTEDWAPSCGRKRCAAVGCSCDVGQPADQ